jgi:hypothetical protein
MGELCGLPQNQEFRGMRAAEGNINLQVSW